MADPEAEAFDCAVLEHVPWIYLGFAPVWLAAALLWAMNNMRHSEHTRELHSKLMLLPLIGLAQTLLSVGFYALCPWESTPLMVALSLCWVLASIVKEPVVIICFVLVSKGCALQPCNHATVQPCNRATLQPHGEGLQPHDERLQPWRSRLQPYTERLQPNDERLQP